MYIFVTVTEKEAYYRDGPSGRIKARLERASGERCLIVPYQEFNMGAVRDLKPRAIAMSGFGGHFQSREVEWFLGMDEVFHECDLPMICFCGSHQVLGFSFNRNLRRVKRLRDEPMKRILPQEDLPRRAQGDPRYDLSRFFVAEGFYPITRLRPDPLFRGLPRIMTMRCSHYCEVKKLPDDFVLLAKSGHCAIEAMRHRDRPLYGTQFHPEAYEAPFFHGRRLLENFAGIVRGFWKQRERGARLGRRS
jgi:GMP synthase-like glutamine amidotransferase